MDAGTDQCLDADMTLSYQLQLDAGLTDGGSSTPMGDILQHCARDVCLTAILSEDHVYECMDTCMQGTAAGALSMGCRGCFIFNVLCVQDQCLLECLGTTGVGQDACFQCSNTLCIPTVERCLGYMRP